MNKRGHVFNGLLLAVGLGFVLEPGADVDTATMIAQISVPIVLGALFPDVDTAFGKHRKTLHNLPVLAVFLAYPILFDNLHFVWIGVVTHYLLDLFGTRRGIAFFYPISEREYELPVGVGTNSIYSDPLTLVITAAEIAAFWAVHTYVVELDANLSAPTAGFGL